MALHAGSGGGGSSAPSDAQFVTLATSGSLSNERVLTAGSGVTLTDGGAGSTLTISASGSGTDTTAWHNTLDSFGAAKKIGTADNFDFTIYANNAVVQTTKTTGVTMFGTSATPVSSSSLVEARKDTNGHVVYSIVNANTGNNALAGFATFMDAAATKSAEWVTTSSGHAGGGGFLVDGLTIATIGLSGGIRLMTRDAFGYSIKIDADGNNIDAYKIDATGHHMINATASLGAETLRVGGQTFIDYTDAVAFRVSRSGSTTAATAVIVNTNWLSGANVAVGIGTAPTYGEFDVCHDWNNQTSGILRNATAGTSASTAWTLFSDGTTRYAEWKITSASLTVGASATYPANAAILSSSACTSGMVVGPLDNAQLMLATNGTSRMTISGAGAFVLAPSDGGLRINNQTTGAGASTGTLTNAPAAGNPAFWLPVSIAGTTRYIPCW